MLVAFLIVTGLTFFIDWYHAYQTTFFLITVHPLLNSHHHPNSKKIVFACFEMFAQENIIIPTASIERTFHSNLDITYNIARGD